MQRAVKQKFFKMQCVSTRMNLSDINTKPLTRQRRNFLLFLIGMVDYDEAENDHTSPVGEDEFQYECQKLCLKTEMNQVRCALLSALETGTVAKVPRNVVRAVVMASAVSRSRAETGIVGELNFVYDFDVVFVFMTLCTMVVLLWIAMRVGQCMYRCIRLSISKCFKWKEAWQLGNKLVAVSRTGTCFHELWCHRIKRSKNVSTLAMYQAKKQKYRACKVCFPECTGKKDH